MFTLTRGMYAEQVKLKWMTTAGEIMLFHSVELIDEDHARNGQG